MKEVFQGRIPLDLLYDTTHDMWVRDADGEVLVGATSFGLFLAGTIIAFTAKPQGAVVERGRGLGTVECAKTVLALHAPLGFVLIEGNGELEEHPDWLNRDPYAAWMVRGRATDWVADKAGLVDAATYCAHIQRLEPGARLA